MTDPKLTDPWFDRTLPGSDTPSTPSARDLYFYGQPGSDAPQFQPPQFESPPSEPPAAPGWQPEQRFDVAFTAPPEPAAPAQPATPWDLPKFDLSFAETAAPALTPQAAISQPAAPTMAQGWDGALFQPRAPSEQEALFGQPAAPEPAPVREFQKKTVILGALLGARIGSPRSAPTNLGLAPAPDVQTSPARRASPALPDWRNPAGTGVPTPPAFNSTPFQRPTPTTPVRPFADQVTSYASRRSFDLPSNVGLHVQPAGDFTWPTKMRQAQPLLQTQPQASAPSPATTSPVAFRPQAERKPGFVSTPLPPFAPRAWPLPNKASAPVTPAQSALPVRAQPQGLPFHGLAVGMGRAPGRQPAARATQPVAGNAPLMKNGRGMIPQVPTPPTAAPAQKPPPEWEPWKVLEKILPYTITPPPYDAAWMALALDTLSIESPAIPPTAAGSDPVTTRIEDFWQSKTFEELAELTPELYLVRSLHDGTGTNDNPRPVRLFGRWLTGIGPNKYIFDEKSKSTQEMINATGTKKARDALYEKYGGHLEDGSKLTGYGTYFGLPGLLNTRTYAEQFVGSYRVDMHVKHGNIYFMISNNSSFTSFFYSIGRDWKRSTFPPMGNMWQIYIWSEPVVQRAAK